jgi:hypothetical protein
MKYYQVMRYYKVTPVLGQFAMHTTFVCGSTDDEIEEAANKAFKGLEEFLGLPKHDSEDWEELTKPS